MRLQILRHRSPPGSTPRERFAPPHVLSQSGAREQETQTQISPRIVRIGRAHLRLFAAIVVGIVIFLLLPGTLLPGGWTLWTRLLVAWDVGLLYYLATTATMMAASTHTDIQQHSEDQDEGAFGLMVLTIAAAAASFGAIFAELAEAKGAPQAGIWPHRACDRHDRAVVDVHPHDLRAALRLRLLRRRARAIAA